MDKRYLVVNPQGMPIFSGSSEREALDFKKRFLFGESYVIKEIVGGTAQG